MSTLTMLKLNVMVLVLFTSVASAQSVQTVDSEAQLAFVLCRNPKEDASNELLLDKNAQLVNVTLWNRLLDCASSAQAQRSPAKSIEIYNLTLGVASRLNKPELMATTYYYLGRTYVRMLELENSIEAYETSRQLFEQAGIERELIWILSDLGRLYFTIEDYEKAQSYSERGLAIAGQIKLSATNESLRPTEYAQARALQTLGQIDLRRGDHDDALQKQRESLGLFEQVNGTSLYKQEMADVLIALAKICGEMGRYSDAFSYLNKATQIAKPSRDANTSANIMSAQASLFLQQEDYAEAEDLFKASLATYRILGNAREEARVLLSLAVIEERQGHNDEALRLFQRSMASAKSLKLADLEVAAGQGLAVVLTEKHDFANALQVINQSLELARRVNAKTREAELLCRAAQTYSTMQNYGKSASMAEQALTLARSLRLPKLTYLATAALGEAYAAGGKTDLAITTLNDAINRVEELRDRTTGRQESRYLFFENKLGPYHTLVTLLTGQGKNFEALMYAERAKGRLLLEAVRGNTADLQKVLTPAERVEIERLHDKVLAIYQRIQSVSVHDLPAELKDQLDAARREFAAFEETLVAAHAELPLRVGPAQPLTYANLNRLVSANDVAYLEYVVARDNIGLFILRRNRVTAEHELKYVKLPVNPDELRRRVNEFHSALAERQPGYDSLGRELYKLLLDPAADELQDIRTLCIVPDAFLWTLPFQALTTKRGNYFVEEHSLFYAPSLSVLKEMALRRHQQSSKESLIAFGNPAIERSAKLKRNLHPIPETKAEIAAVASAVRTHIKRVLVGHRADEKIFKAFAPQYATIHIASHGVLDNRNPLNSYLLLTKTNGDWENDGLLQAREIIEMRLDADLAVLSACETGNGRYSPGEGVVGMSWAFLFAGARSVIVSQWRVNSASTSQLMTNFYQAMARQNVSNSTNKSQALREASLSLLKDRRYRHPFYWAGFVLVSSN